MKKLFTLLIAASCSFAGLKAQNTSATAVPITALPYASGTLTTCGSVDDYPKGSFYAGAANYGAGEDYVFSYTSTSANQSVKFTIAGGVAGTDTYKMVSVHSNAVPTTANAIGGVTTSSGISGNVTLTLPTVGTYYIFVDTWPTPNCAAFTLNVEAGPLAPNCATLSTPANGTTVATLTPTLTWSPSATGVAPTAYKVYLGTVNPPTALTSTVAAPATSYTPTTALLYGTTYYWFVTPTNDGSDAAGCNANVYSFTTPPPPPPPANDDCAGATTLTVNPNFACGAVTAGTTVSATASTGTTPTCSATGINDDVWYTFTATNAVHRVSLLNLTGTSTSMAMQAYSGSCGSLVAVACTSTSTLNLTGLTVGNVYTVRVYTSSATATSRASFNICVGTPPPPPANDNCSGAVNLTVNPDFNCGTVTAGYTDSATQSVETAPTCAATGINDDVWYTFTATNAAHRISLTNIVGTTDMAMQVYSGACGSLVAVQCSDPETMNLTGLTVGTQYTVRVYTYTATATSRASFNICVGTPGPPPANDDCATPMALTPGATFAQNAITGSNSSATNTTDATATTACQTIRNKDVWFSVVVPASGNITIETDAAPGSPITDMVLGVYTGTCGALTSVGCDDDSGNGLFSQVVLTGQTPGSTLLIAAYSYSSTDEGAFRISAFDGALGTTNIVKNENGVNIYPNPFTDFIRISDVKDVVSVSVIDMAGRVVKTMKPAREINLSSLQSGMYLINLTMKDGSVKSVKSIKK